MHIGDELTESSNLGSGGGLFASEGSGMGWACFGVEGSSGAAVSSSEGRR